MGSGIATRAVLEGFRFKSDDGNVWHCAFEPVFTVAPGNQAYAREHIELEAQPKQRYPTNRLFENMQRALRDGRGLTLALYWLDVLGNAYRSEVLIESATISLFKQQGWPEPTTLQPKMVDQFPESLDPA